MNRIIDDVLRFWMETWQVNKTLFFAEALGSLLGMGAAAIMAITAPNPNLLWVFTMYVISAIMLMYASYKRRSSWMLVLMTFYAVTTSFGLFRLLFGG